MKRKHQYLTRDTNAYMTYQLNSQFDVYILILNAFTEDAHFTSFGKAIILNCLYIVTQFKTQ